MTRTQIIRMAHEADASFETVESMFKFAALVAQAEREALLDLVDEYAKNNLDLKAAIRARSKA